MTGVQTCALPIFYKEGEAYKVTVFKRSGIRRKLKPETYLLQEISVEDITKELEKRHVIDHKVKQERMQ